MEEEEGWRSSHSLVRTELAKFKQKYQSVLISTHILVRAGDIQAIYCIPIICSHGWDVTLLGTTYICEAAVPQGSVYQKIFPCEAQAM